MPQFELRAGSAVAGVSPEAGGSLVRYASDPGGGVVDWLRPASPDAIDSRSAGGLSSFPMVPFSNRIRDARFHFRGRLIQLSRNFRPEPHAIHGHGWRQPWTVTTRDEASATLEYRHPADDWPWTYRARQTLELTERRLTILLDVRNEAADPMPVGFGLHPYFVRTPLVRLRAEVGPMWRADANAMPIELVAPLPDLRMDGPGLSPDATPLDNNFLEFAGRATVEWPERRARLRVTADPVFSCLVIYTPPGRDFFCAEPATNCIDGFNLFDMGRTDTGVLVVEPGARVEGRVVFAIEPEGG